MLDRHSVTPAYTTDMAHSDTSDDNNDGNDESDNSQCSTKNFKNKGNEISANIGSIQSSMPKKDATTITSQSTPKKDDTTTITTISKPSSTSKKLNILKRK